MIRRAEQAASAGRRFCGDDSMARLLDCSMVRRSLIFCFELIARTDFYSSKHKIPSFITDYTAACRRKMAGGCGVCGVCGECFSESKSKKIYIFVAYHQKKTFFLPRSLVNKHRKHRKRRKNIGGRQPHQYPPPALPAQRYPPPFKRSTR